MTVDVLNDQQKENQQKVTKMIKGHQAKQRRDTRDTVIALVVALLLMQCIDLLFATEEVQHFIAEGSKKAATVIEEFLVHLVHLGVQCDARGDSSYLCQLYIMFSQLDNQESSKDAFISEESQEQSDSTSEIFHVIQHDNVSTIYDAALESIDDASENMATLVKTVDPTEDTGRVANHPLLRLILHNPFFLQIFLPFIITVLALTTQKFIPGRGNATAATAYFMLVFFFFARLFLQLY